MNEQTLNLRDIHLPDPISWWPLAPGWWIIFTAVILLTIAFIVAIKIYISKQLKREITAELENIKQQFEQSQNKSQLAKSLSVLLRRANMSFYSTNNIAGLTGEHWLNWLDKTNTNSLDNNKFQSDTGEILLTAPYLPDNAHLDFDSNKLIHLCETWLLSPHKKPSLNKAVQVQTL